MTKEQYEDMIQLCADKKAARKAGYAHICYKSFYKKQGLTYRTYGSGKIAEVAMCYMLGLVQSICPKYFSIYTSVKDDQCGVDYTILANGRRYEIQQKFAKTNQDYYPEPIVVIGVGADKSFSGKSEIDPMNGNVALVEVLVRSGAFTEEEVYDIMDEHEDIEKACICAWRSIKG